MEETKIETTTIATNAPAPAPFVVNEDEERRLIQSAYRNLLRSIKNKTPEDRVNIRLAYEIAVEAHKEQRRKNGEPYILHPIEVARICAQEIGLGATSVVSALLHDVVEDTNVSLDEIHEKFGDKITMMVGGLTKLDNMMDTESPQAENFKKILRTLTSDVRIVLIKLADRLHNMRTIGAMPLNKQMKIASETAFIYAPLAHRLGLYNIKTELEDLTMKVMEPENYRLVAKKLQETRREREKYIARFIEPLVEDLNQLGIEYRIFGRPKSISSIWKKIRNKSVEFEQIYDLFAIRVVINVERTKEKIFCWNVYSVVTDHYTPIPERLKDFISVPKGNGYESLHTTVVGQNGRFVEVQIRSERMDEIAERGFAAHWKYKGGQSQDVFDVWINGVREVLESSDHNAIELVNDIKTNLFSEEVYVFTPTGDMKMFPKGATALDFAFEIHTEIGYHCNSVKVNQKLVPLSYKLQNGDQVSVITNKNQKPNESWLTMVVTGRAKSKIRQALRDEKRKAGEIGKEVLDRKFTALKANMDETNIEFLVKYFGLNSRTDLYYEIAQDKAILSRLAALAVEKGRFLEKPKPAPAPEPKTDQEPKPLTKKPKITPLLLLNGEDASQLAYSFATCCNPVQGDEIFGYLTTGGVKIHRKRCPNATNMLANYAYRVMNAEWVNRINAEFVADLRINGVDYIGVVQQLTNIITNVLHVNMRAIEIHSNDGFYEGKISLVVQNTDQLNFIIRTLKNVEGVATVQRIL